MAGLLGNTGWGVSSRTDGKHGMLIPTATHCWTLSTKGCRAWVFGTYGTVRKCYRVCSQGPANSTLSISWPCTMGCALRGSLPPNSGNTTLNTVRPNQTRSRVSCTHAGIYSDSDYGLSLGHLFTLEKQ